MILLEYPYLFYEHVVAVVTMESVVVAHVHLNKGVWFILQKMFQECSDDYFKFELGKSFKDVVMQSVSIVAKLKIANVFHRPIQCSPKLIFLLYDKV